MRLKNVSNKALNQRNPTCQTNMIITVRLTFECGSSICSNSVSFIREKVSLTDCSMFFANQEPDRWVWKCIEASVPPFWPPDLFLPSVTPTAMLLVSLQLPINENEMTDSLPCMFNHGLCCMYIYVCVYAPHVCLIMERMFYHALLSLAKKIFFASHRWNFVVAELIII